MFLTIIALVNYNTVYEKIQKEITHTTMTHSMEIIILFTMYFGLYAPVSWKYISSILVSSQCYYYSSTIYYHGTARLSLPLFLQNMLLMYLTGRVLFLKEESGVENI